MRTRRDGATEDSVLLRTIRPGQQTSRNDELASKWSDLLKVRSVSNKALELARAQSKLGKTQEAHVMLTFESEAQATLARALGSDLRLC